MKTIILVLLLAVTYSYAAPDCTSLSCSNLQKCAWTCEATSKSQLSTVDVDKCDDNQATCTIGGADGTCKPACVSDPAIPVCSQPQCEPPDKCAWTCTDNGNVLSGVDASSCKGPDAECGQGTSMGQCKAGCVPAEPECSNICTDSQTCSWTCKDSGVDLPGADVTKCGTDNTCTSGDETGTCSSECVDNTDSKSGSSKIAIFAPFLVLGTSIQLCFQP